MECDRYLSVDVGIFCYIFCYIFHFLNVCYAHILRGYAHV